MLPLKHSIQHAPQLFSMLAAAAFLAGCGGNGDSTAPTEAYPAAAGAYQISGNVDGEAVIESHMGGTVTFTQPSLTNGTLAGSATLTGSFLGGQVVTIIDDALDASISSAGVIMFTLADANGTWTLTGKLSGNVLQDGRHRFTLPNGGWLIGGWSGFRTN